MKKLICVLIAFVLLFGGSALATTWSGGHEANESGLEIQPGDILDNSFGVNGNIYVSGGYNCTNWATWCVSWGSAHKSFQVTGVTRSGKVLRLTGEYITTDGYDDDNCRFTNVTYTWDGLSCTADGGTCLRNSRHSGKETVEADYIVVTPVSCVSPMVVDAVATFGNKALGSDSKTNYVVGDPDPDAHAWGEITYTWDGKECTAQRVCANDTSHIETETVTGEYVVDTEADCENVEIGHYEAKFENAAFDTQKSESFIGGEATGHSWGEPEYSWSGDECTAQRICANDETHIETETVTGIYVTNIEASCEVPETGHYEAEFANAAFGTIESEAFFVGEANGHDWGEPTYTWEDNECTARRVCISDDTHIETETVTGSYVLDTEADCENAETGHYEAEFANDAFATAMSEAFSVGEALGHSWGEPEYVWNGNVCIATQRCENDDTHLRTEKEDGEYVIDTEADCENAETGHYEAFDGKAVTETEIVGEALGHDWGEPEYTWDGDECSAVYTCANDVSHVIMEIVDGDYVVDVELDCEVNEVGHYEAFGGATASESFTAKEAPGHAWGDPTYSWNGSECTATYVCENNAEHKKAEIVDGEYIIDREANCEQSELGHYEAFDGAATTEAVTVGEELGHVFGNWRTENGMKVRYCEVCGTCEIMELPLMAETSFISLEGEFVRQELTVEELPVENESESKAKVLVIAPTEDNELTEKDPLTTSFALADVKNFEKQEYVKVIIRSAFETVEVVFTPEELYNVIETVGGARIEVVVTEQAELPEGTEIELPEGMTQNSVMKNVSLIIYDKDGNVIEADEELLKDIKIRIYDAAPLSDANNDIVGLYIEDVTAEEIEIIELSAEYFYDETTEIGYWELPAKGSGLYFIAEKQPE